MTATSNGATAELERADLMSDAETMATVFDTMQTRVMVADANLDLVYINELALNTLRQLEPELVATFGVTVDELLGGSIHRFHRDPAKVERTLADVAGFPREVAFEFGDTTIATKINLIRRHGEVVGYVVVWEDVTEQQRLAAEAARISSMMENSPTNMMYADRDLVVRYMNPASLDTLRSLEQHLPVKADEIVGQSIDIFHKDPSHQRRMLGDPSTHLPSQANIQVGPETLDLLVSPITDSDGTYIGAMATWQVITDKIKLEQEREEAAERERVKAQELEVILSTVASNSEALAAAAEELQVVSEQMGANSNETSKQVNLVTEGSAEVSRNIETVAAGSEQMSASIKEIAKSSAEAAKVAADAVEAARSTTGTVSSLGESSTEIGKIVKVITGIAQQTNLLALNATIEAARAGEAGKGFAVVANEVKELAKETARATEDISQKIEAIQGDTKRSVEAIDGISTIINQIAEYQDTIASAVEEQAATTSEIAASVNEASRGSTEITENMAAVAQVAESTASGAADSQRAAAELAQMSAELQGLVSQAKT